MGRRADDRLGCGPRPGPCSGKCCCRWPVARRARKTETEPRAAPPGSPAKLKPDSSTLKQAVDETAYHATGRAALEAAGFDLARDVQHYGVVRQWMADGASEALILEVIGRSIAKGARPGHLGYFSKAVAEALSRPAVVQDLGAKSAAFTLAMQEWQMFKAGPMPHPDWFAADGSRRVAA